MVILGNPPPQFYHYRYLKTINILYQLLDVSNKVSKTVYSVAVKWYLCCKQSCVYLQRCRVKLASSCPLANLFRTRSLFLCNVIRNTICSSLKQSKLRIRMYRCNDIVKKQHHPLGSLTLIQRVPGSNPRRSYQFYSSRDHAHLWLGSDSM